VSSGKRVAVAVICCVVSSVGKVVLNFSIWKVMNVLMDMWAVVVSRPVSPITSRDVYLVGSILSSTWGTSPVV
jgi:hypothetical protein